MTTSASLDQFLNVYDIIMKCVHRNVDVLISDVDIFWGGKKTCLPLHLLGWGSRLHPRLPRFRRHCCRTWFLNQNTDHSRRVPLWSQKTNECMYNYRVSQKFFYTFRMPTKHSRDRQFSCIACRCVHHTMQHILTFVSGCQTPDAPA